MVRLPIASRIIVKDRAYVPPALTVRACPALVTPRFRALLCAKPRTTAQGASVDRYARWNALLELLTESGRVSVEDVAAKLNVSQATIRRDFDQLAQQQMITR